MTGYTSTDIYRVVRDASKHLDQRVQALLKAGLLISVRRHSPEVRRLPASHLLDELPNPRSRDPAQLPDLDTAKLSGVDEVVRFVADVQDFHGLLDRQELAFLSAAACRRSLKALAARKQFRPAVDGVTSKTADTFLPLGLVLWPELGDFDVLDIEACVPDPQDDIAGTCPCKSDGAVLDAIDGDGHVHAVND